MIIAIDFDGTIVEHRYPKIGDAVPGAIDWMRQFLDAGAKLILWTMRSGDELGAAVDYCETFGIKFYGVNGNPSQGEWTKSPKAYAHVYIDDAAFGCPLIQRGDGDRPYVDWEKVGPVVLEVLSAKAEPK